MNRLLLTLLALSAAVGCGPRFGKRVPDALLTRLPYESRIELLEAENDLAVAIDRRDEAQNEVGRTRVALRRAKERLDAAEDEVSHAEDAVAREVAQLAVAEAEARVDYLRAQQAVNVRKLEVEDLRLRCAHARFEQARLHVSRRAKVQGSEELDPSDFEGQVKACDAAVAEEKAAMKEQTQAAAQARESWDKHKQALAKRTFDARASPYVE